MKKKIILFINTLASGGAEHQLVVLANGLIERGYNIIITTFGDVKDHYAIHPEINRCRIAPGKNNIIKMLAIWKYFFTVNADWVIGFGQRESTYCLEALLFRSRKHIRFIASERNTTIGEPSFYEKLLMLFLYRRADYIVPNSHSQYKHIIHAKPKYESKTVTITNYTDLSIYKPKPLPFRNEVKICIFGRYDKQKNGLLFIEALKLLRNKTNQAFRIEWFGNQSFKDMKPNPYYLAMREKIEEYELQNYLVLYNQIKNVSEVMSEYDVFCLPSLWEGFSNAISEAICCGLPCLVSDVADNGIMVHNGENGFLFDPKSVDSIVDAYLNFFSLSKEKRQHMGYVSRRRAEELFNCNKFLDAYENLFLSKY